MPATGVLAERRARIVYTRVYSGATPEGFTLALRDARAALR